MQKLLLHICCAPCSSGVIEELKKEFDVTVYFYNPNIDTSEEYEKRAQEVRRFMGLMDVNYVIENHDSPAFYSAVKGLEHLPEGGERCVECFRLRLNKTFEYAENNNYDLVTTTLSVSPYKSIEQLNMVGKELSERYNLPYLARDFKKKNGYLKSIQNSKKYNLYRQNYCGCVFSKRRDYVFKKKEKQKSY